MKYIKSKTYPIVCTVILAGLSCVQTVCAEQSGASYSEEVLVTDGELGSQRGQGGVIVSNAQVTGNVINIGSGGTVISGNNILGDHALDNVNGITSVVQNSGNNVSIQNNTLVNVNFQ
jgi:hypothetical protein